MALTDLLTSMYTSLSFTELHAEAPPADEEDSGESDEKDNEGSEEKGQDSAKEEEGGDEEEGEGGDDESGGDDDDEEEEEEEEEEPEDPKPKIEEECSRSAACAPLKHHYEECVERVTAQHENPDHKGPKEDCVEEFFHLSHCASQCAAPKLFRALK